ncbi:SpoIIE family protein phosphatase [Streptomyces actuosus]|uniref:SpoIIE family protein phosphatase n=1 Tax=Streptomyces actuosus TaxID=1885 RepID=A0ABS2VUT5_STRAS|nr:SpoIIE family protein phosphatase [Streptomyces actuosus]MBN0046806.1 SpoIIE family protein phosphatase [Streptomyces actuosus]
MDDADRSFPREIPARHQWPAPPGVLLDLLSVSAVVVDSGGRIVFWSPQADDVFGYTAKEALGQYAVRLLVHKEHRYEVMRWFARLRDAGTSWAGAFPIRHKDGSTRLVEFRNMRLLDDVGDVYVLGIAADQAMVQGLETKLALSDHLVSQSPVGVALLDPDLRYVLVNPALARINGIPAADHIGRRPRDIHPDHAEIIESALRQVLGAGVPLIDRYLVGRTQADPEHDHAYSVSYYRLTAPSGRVIGVANSVVDVTERHLAAAETERARRRLTLLADASARIGTTLETERTARELAAVAVPDLADVAAVDILDSVLAFRRSSGRQDGPELFRALAVAGAYPTGVTGSADVVGELSAYGADRLITQCVRTGQPVVVPRAQREDLLRIARDADAAEVFARAGVHSYLAVPLIAHNQVLGAFDVMRARNPLPFDHDDVLLARELAARAAVAIDNARWHENVRNSAETLQRSLLPVRPPPRLAGLDVASRYEPAQASSEIGGDWYDVVPVAGDRTALVVGDVMGKGIDAAAAMGQLRATTCAYADLGMAPHEVLQHLDKITCGLEDFIATSVYAVYDPHRHRCRIANAGHLPPVIVRAGRRPELLALSPGAPLGVGGVRFRTSSFVLEPGDRLVLYTDGLVETRDDPIDERLTALLNVLDGLRQPLEETCDWLLNALRHPYDRDDVALLIAEARPLEKEPDRTAGDSPETC